MKFFFTDKSKAVVIATVMALIFTSSAVAQKYSGSPVTKDRLIKTVTSKQFSVPMIVKVIKDAGVDFEMTNAIERELTSIRANPQIIAAARDNYRYAGVAKNGREAPPKPPVNSASAKYDQLVFQGLQSLQQVANVSSLDQARNIVNGVINVGNQAIKLDPVRSEAYFLVGRSYLLLQNYGQAETYVQRAIDHGGSFSFPVYHLAGTPHLEFLHIGNGYATVESDQKFFKYSSSEIPQVGRQQDYFYAGQNVATFGMLTVQAGQRSEWYFSPGFSGSPQEADLILRIIKKNVFGG